jgi:hypothetical protein
MENVSGVKKKSKWKESRYEKRWSRVIIYLLKRRYDCKIMGGSGVWERRRLI